MLCGRQYLILNQDSVKPGITPAQRAAVWAEFKKFGYNPNSEGEVDYWAAKPIGNLFSELKKRKDTEPKAKMTNEALYKMYDEFGLANRLKSQADYDWAKKNLPNDPEALKKILKTEQAKELTAQKATGKVNTGTQGTPGIIKQEAANINNQKVQPVSTTKIGQFDSPTGHLIKFTGDPNGAAEGDASTLWYLNPDDFSLRPIMTRQAFNDIFNNDPKTIADAVKSINTMDPKVVQPGGEHSNYFLLGADYGIYDGLRAKKLDFTPKQIAQRYGQAAGPISVKAAADLDQMLNMWKYSDSGLSKEQIDKIQTDVPYVAGLIGSLAYGDYSFADVWKEMKRKVAADSGDATAQNAKIIDASSKKGVYSATQASKTANALYTLPDTIANMDTEMLSQPLVQLGDDFYKTLYSGENYDPTNPSFVAKAQQVKESGHDIVLEMLQADTVAAKAAADQAFEKWRTDAEKTLGISLQKDALAAWNQIGSIIDKNQEAGLSGSGIEAEQIDKSLRDTRQIDQWNREATQTATDNKEEERMKASGSPAEIKKMNDEDAAKGLPRSEWRSVKWGLAPAEAMTPAKFLADFRAKYPDNKRSDAQILGQEYAQYYDENGNKRSTLYQKSEDARQTTMFGGTWDQLVAKTGSYEDFQNKQTIKDLEIENKKAQGANAGEDPENPYGEGVANLNETDPSQAAIQKDLGISPKAFAVKPGTSYIPNTAAMKNYTGIYKDPATNKLYGTPNSTPKPFAVKPGTSYIPNVASIKNYTNTYTDPATKKMYGTPTTTNKVATGASTAAQVKAATNLGTQAKTTTPAVTPKTTTAPVNAFAGMTKISNADELKKYTKDQIVRDPNSTAIYLKK